MKKISSKKKTNIYYKSKSKSIHMHSKLFISWRKKSLKTSYSTIISKNHFLYNQVHNSSIRELQQFIGWNVYTCIEYSLQLNVLNRFSEYNYSHIHRLYITMKELIANVIYFLKSSDFILFSPRINYCISIPGKAFHSS